MPLIVSPRVPSYKRIPIPAVNRTNSQMAFCGPKHHLNDSKRSAWKHIPCPLRALTDVVSRVACLLCGRCALAPVSCSLMGYFVHLSGFREAEKVPVGPSWGSLLFFMEIKYGILLFLRDRGWEINFIHWNFCLSTVFVS